MKKLKKNYRILWMAKTAKTLEDTLIKRLDQVDTLLAANDENAKNIERLFANMKFAFQKVGLVKYDAFHEMGGKLSFPWLCLMKQTTVLLSMQCTAERDAILISKKS